MNNADSKMILANNIIKFMELKGLTRQELANRLNVKYSTFCDWVQPKHASYPKTEMINKIAIELGVNFLNLVRDNNPLPDEFKIELMLEDNEMIPVIGKVPAGTPTEAIEDSYAINYTPISKNWLRGNKKFFALLVDGDSMESEFHDGDIAIFLKTPVCDSGSNCCVRLPDGNVTFKKVTFTQDKIWIEPLNLNNSSGFTPIYFNRYDDNASIEILGVCVDKRRKELNY